MKRSKLPLLKSILERVFHMSCAPEDGARVPKFEELQMQTKNKENVEIPGLTSQQLLNEAVASYKFLLWLKKGLFLHWLAQSLLRAVRKIENLAESLKFPAIPANLTLPCYIRWLCKAPRSCPGTDVCQNLVEITQDVMRR